MNDQVRQKYLNKLLGVSSRNENPDYFLADFLDEKKLVQFIISTVDHQMTFTKDGFNFLEEYYGLDQVINIVLKDYPDYPFDEGLFPREALLVKKEFALDMDVLNKMPN